MQMTIACRVDVGIRENPHTTGRGVAWQTKGCRLADRSSNSYEPLASRFIRDERRVTAPVCEAFLPAVVTCCLRCVRDSSPLHEVDFAHRRAAFSISVSFRNISLDWKDVTVKIGD